MNPLLRLTSRTARRARELHKLVIYELSAQRDVLATKAQEEVARGLNEFQEAVRGFPSRETLRTAIKQLEETAVKWLQPYPNESTRENFKEFLTSGVLILAIFCFFIQPMKIPSGSAQPTLYGNLVVDLRNREVAALPNRFGRFIDWFKGIDYHHWVAKAGGDLRVGEVRTMFGFVKTQRFEVGRDAYTFWWPPETLLRDCGIRPGQSFKAGETILKLRVSSGDRLFIDRFTYNFRRPRRGETIVFTSTGIPGLIQNTHYIKRLIAAGGEKVLIGDDRQVVIDGRRLDASTPGFAKVYSFTGPPRESVYSGHVNDAVGLPILGRSIAPLFPDGTKGITVRPNHYLAFGDNTLNSFDGRAWGDFPREKVVGKAWFVFWPFTHRLGPIEWW